MKQRSIEMYVCAPDGTKLCQLYDSMSQFPGQAANLKIVYDEDELTQMSFDVPRKIPDENGNEVENFRWDLCRNEYQVWYIEDGVTEVFVIKETKETDKGGVESGSVSCLHRAEQLKKRGFAIELDGFTGQTCELMDAVLEGTGWSRGTVENFYEEDLFDKTLSVATTGGLYDTPIGISVGAYLEIPAATGYSAWSAANGWQNAGIHIETHSKNICDGLIERGHLNDSDGTPEYSTQTNAYRTINYVDISAFAGQKMTLSGTDVGGAMWHFFNGAKTQLSTATGLTATIPSGAKFLKYELWKNADGSANYATPPTNVQLEKGETATAYEEYMVPYTIDVPVLGTYDRVTRNHVIRRTIYDDTNHTTSRSDTILATETLDVYTARLYEGGTISATNSGAGAFNLTLGYTVPTAGTGTTPREKVRSISKSAGEGSYSALRDIAEIMGGKLKFDGYNKTVSLVHTIGKDTRIAFKPTYNLKSISREKNSNETVTRMYIGDMDGVTISGVNPLGTNYLLNFEYARGAGLMTAAQETALSNFESTVSGAYANLLAQYDLQADKLNQINNLIGDTPFGTAQVVSVSGATLTLSEPIYYEGGFAPTTESTLYLRDGNGVWQNYAVSSYNAGTRVLTLGKAPGAASYVCWYEGALPGIMGARIIAIKSKQETYDLAKKRYDAATDNTEKATYQAAMNDAQQGLNELSKGTATMVGLSQMYAELVQHISDLEVLNAQIDVIQQTINTANATFETAMGDLLRDGMYTEGEYVPGQENALYTDAKEALAKAAVPQVEYSVDALDRSWLENAEYVLDGEIGEDVRFGDIVYVTDAQMNVENLPCTVTRYVDAPMSGRCNSFNVGNFDQTGIDLFDSIINAAKTVDDNTKQMEKMVSLNEYGLIDPDIVRRSVLAAEIGKDIDLSGNGTIAQQDVTDMTNFVSAVSQVVQDNLVTGALNAAVIDWTKVDALTLAVNSLVVEATDGIELRVANSIHVGGTNLLRGTKTFSTEGGWETTTYITHENLSDGKVAAVITRSGLTSDGWTTLIGRRAALDNNWIGRQVTMSGYVYSDDWAAVDYGVVLVAELYTASTGSRSRYSNTIYIDNVGEVAWGSNGICHETALENGKWCKFWYTFTLNEATMIYGSAALSTMNYVNASILLRRNGSVKFKELKLEWGNKATSWSPAPEDTDAEFSSVRTELSLVPGKITAAVESIHVGGTNLLLKTATALTKTLSGGTNQIIGSYAFSNQYLSSTKANKQVTCSFDWSTTATSGTFLLQLNASTWNRFSDELTISASNQSGHSAITLNLNAGFDTSTATGIMCRCDNITGTITIKNVKLEWGNKATSWSPAPEDTDAAIESIRSELSLVPGEITAAVSGTRVVGRNLLRGTAELACTNTLFSSTMYLPATQAWPLWEPAFVATRTTEGIRGTTDADKMSGFIVPLAYEGAVAGGETYTLSFTYKTNLSTFGTPYIMCRVGGNVSATSISPPVSTTEWANFSTQITWPSTANKFPYAVLVPYVKASGGWLELKDRSVKLEKGTKATAWSPAPEDSMTASNLLMGTETSVSAAFNAPSTYGVTLPYLTDGRKTFADLGLKVGDYITIAFRWVISNATTYGNFRAEMYGKNGTQNVFLAAIKNPVATFSSSHWFGDEVLVHQLTSTTINGVGVAFRIDNSVLTFTVEHMTIVPGQIMSGSRLASGELINNSITINDKGIRLSATGFVQIDAQSATDSYISLGDESNFYVSKAGGLRAANGHFSSSLDVNGQAVLTKADFTSLNKIMVSTSQPSNVHSVLWFQPSSVTNVQYTGYTADSRNSTVQFGSSQRTITRSFTPTSTNSLANSTFTYTLEFIVISLADVQLTDVYFTATATKGSSTITFPASASISLNKYGTAVIDLTLSSTVNLASNTNAISVAITATSSAYGALFLDSKQYMTLTIQSSAGSGTQACNVFYIN